MFAWNDRVSEWHNLYTLGVGINQAYALAGSPGIPALQSDVGDMPCVRSDSKVDMGRPAIAIYRNGQKAVICIGGISGRREAAATYNGWRVPQEILSGYGPWNALTKLWFDQTASLLQSLMDSDLNDIAVAGHSLGGSLAAMWAKRLRHKNGGATVRYASFGSPRFCTSEFWDQFQGIDMCRVMNWRDVVPYLVPWFNEAPYFSSLHFATSLGNFAKFSHPNCGVNIRLNYPPVFAMGPAGLSYPLELNVDALLQILSEGVYEHLMTTYTGTMFGMQVSQPGQLHTPVLPVQGVEPEKPVPLSPDEAQQIAEFPRRGWPRAPRGGNNPGIPPEPQILKPLPALAGVEGTGIKIKRSGGQWWVVRGGSTLYKAQSKKDAKAWARAARAMAVQYAQAPFNVIDTGALQAAFDGEPPTE